VKQNAVAYLVVVALSRLMQVGDKQSQADLEKYGDLMSRLKLSLD
jgi:hypothetical protein